MKKGSMKNIFKYFLVFITFFSVLNALEIPKGSKFDRRIAYTDFNAEDVFKLVTKKGHVSVIEFDSNERIINVATGFSDGWELVDKENLLFVKPKPLVTKYVVSDDPENQAATQEIIVDPYPSQWKTNLIVTTNYSMYVFELNIGSNEVYKLSFNYPDKELAKAFASLAAKEIQDEKDRVKTSLNRVATPRNWEFYMKVAKDSEDIAPNFAYDDGVFTYLGFDNTKTFPSVFGIDKNEEQILNTHVKKDGNYDVLVIHKTMPRIILRSGNKVVGVLNKGYAKNPPQKTQQTSNDNEVERALKNGN